MRIQLLSNNGCAGSCTRMEDFLKDVPNLLRLNAERRIGPRWLPRPLAEVYPIQSRCRPLPTAAANLTRMIPAQTRAHHYVGQLMFRNGWQRMNPPGAAPPESDAFPFSETMFRAEC